MLEHDPELDGVDLAVCLEPSDNKLHLGCNGSIHATVTFEGQDRRTARGPWEGENAITRPAPFLAELARCRRETSLIDGLTYRTVTTVTQAKDGGRGRNVVPDRFVLNLNHRFAPDLARRSPKADVLALVGDRAESSSPISRPAALPERAPPARPGALAAGVRGVEPKQAWTDVARFAARGLAAVNFGPGENAQAHQKNESTVARPRARGLRDRLESRSAMFA